MAKTSAALGRLAEKRLPFISILTYPTTGGVTASFATLGDIILAEPGAMIGFAVFGIAAGMAMNMGGAWIATVIGLCVLAVFIEVMIALGGLLLG